jgi:hypothetical protein
MLRTPSKKGLQFAFNKLYHEHKVQTCIKNIQPSIYSIHENREVDMQVGWSHDKKKGMIHNSNDVLSTYPMLTTCSQKMS